MNRWTLFAAALLLMLIGGCGAPRVLGARALLPLQSEDTTRVWIYLESNDANRDGVYRCVDEGAQVMCVKATLH